MIWVKNRGVKKLRMGVVGVGHLGFHHARLLKKLAEVELVAVCDTDPARLKWTARKLRLPAYSNFRELIGRIDAVNICVPTSDHFPVAMPFLDAGVHTFIEKPITRDLGEADALINRAREKNLVLQVGHVERFNQALQALKEYPGRIYFVEAHRLAPFKKRNLDIGAILDLMIHDIDIVLELVPSAVSSIEAVGARVLSTQEDIANARLRFQNGCVANLTTSRLTNRTMRKIRVFQENCYLSIDYARQAAAVYHKEGNKIVSKKMRIRRREPLWLELVDFVTKVSNHNGSPLIDVKAREALATALEITRQVNIEMPV